MKRTMKKGTWRSCGSKNRYRDEHTVNHYRKMFEKERGVKLDYYWCPYCKGFHLTSREYVVYESQDPEMATVMVG